MSASLHILWTTGPYIARVRDAGCRNYRVLGKPMKSYARAIKRMAAAFAAGKCKRGDVLRVQEYYDPIQVCEMVRR